MMNRKQIAIFTLAVTGLFGLFSQATAATVDEIRYSDEVRSCISEIGNHLSYDDASRVRHDVTLVKPKLVGYVMKIDTSIYTESGVAPNREYATYCVVNGDHKPLKFEISENGA